MSLFDAPFVQIKGVTLTSTTPGIIHTNSDLIVTDTSFICNKSNVYNTYELLYKREKDQRARVLAVVSDVNSSYQNSYTLTGRSLSIGSTQIFRC